MAKRIEVNSSREAALWVIRQLRGQGHVAYLAGGCVRDRLLGLMPKDHDVATDALLEVVKKLIPRTRLVGEAFGVALARVGSWSIEIATFRRESGYEDGRHPTKVEFTDAREDAVRRDFTVNGLFEDPFPSQVSNDEYQDASELATRTLDDGSVILDYVQGLQDLDALIIRAIGDPDMRFADDYLRMLRAVRFAAKLDFTIEPETAKAIRPLARYLGSISRERIGEETKKMLVGPKPALAASLCQSLWLDGPTLNEDHKEPLLPTLQAIQHWSEQHPEQKIDIAVALGAWMLDRAELHGDLAGIVGFIHTSFDKTLGRWRDALCLSNELRDQLARSVRLIVRLRDWDQLDIAGRKRVLAESGYAAARQLLIMAGIEKLVERIDVESAPLFEEGVNPEPFVTGDDLIKLGHKPSPHFKTLLDEAYDRQLDGRDGSREQAMDWLRDQSVQA